MLKDTYSVLITVLYYNSFNTTLCNDALTEYWHYTLHPLPLTKSYNNGVYQLF